jgi:hypothetical protein
LQLEGHSKSAGSSVEVDVFLHLVRYLENSKLRALRTADQSREDTSFAFMQLIYPSPLMNTGTEQKIRPCEKK